MTPIKRQVAKYMFSRMTTENINTHHFAICRRISLPKMHVH